MKKIIIYLLTSTLLLSLWRCSDGTDDVFDRTASERVQQSIQQIKTLLQSSESGWVMDYYLPEFANAVSILCKFNEDGTVTMSRLFSRAGQNQGDPAVIIYDYRETSQYVVEPDAGPMLSFNTYNTVIHQYADPGNDGVGYAGDYEFIVTDFSDDRIVVRGKKHEVEMTMWRMEPGRDWVQYLTDVYSMMDLVQATIQSDWRKKIITIDGQLDILHHNTLRGMLFPRTVSSEGFIDYNVTDKGIRIQKPITLYGVEVYEFRPDQAVTQFKAPNADITITKGQLRLNEQLLYNGIWGIAGASISPLMQDKWLAMVSSSAANSPLGVSLGSRRNSQGRAALSIQFMLGIFLTPAIYYYDFIPVEGTHDVVTLRYGDVSDAAGSYFMENSTDASAVMEIFNILGGTFKVTVVAGTEEYPTELLFTNVDNPDHYFTGRYGEYPPIMP